MKRDAIFWLLALFASVYILGNIGTGSLSTWDEAVYANISAGIIRTGDWFIMHDGLRPWFEKPPLYMWCTAFFYNIFGINEFSVRLTSALFGIATVLLVYIFAKKIAGRDTAVLAALILLASPHYLHFSKMGMMDVMLTFFVTLMLYLFWLGRERRACLFWSGIALIFAYFAKGFAAVAGPAAILFYCLISKNLRMALSREFILGISISIAVILTWHFAQYMLAGPAAVDNYFGFHLIKRAATSVEGHTGGLNFYQKVIFNKNKPWGALFYISAAYAAWLAVRYREGGAFLMLSWIAVVFVICTAVRTKLHWYIMPIYPALAMVSAVFLNRFFKGRFFPQIAALILVGMLAQVPASWAFKLDLNPSAKNASLTSKKLAYTDNGTIFYYETVKMKFGNKT